MFSDPKSKHLGKQVPLDQLGNSLALGQRGLLEHEGEVEAIQEIGTDELDSFADSQRGALGDLRVLPPNGFCPSKMAFL